MASRSLLSHHRTHLWKAGFNDQVAGRGGSSLAAEASQRNVDRCALRWRVGSRALTGVRRGTSCVASGPVSAAYTANVCISLPADGASLSGEQSVSGTITVTGTNPGISRAVFYLRGAYLLTDYASPYAFVLPTSRFVDGVAVIEMEANMRDGFVSAHASISVTLNNGVTTPPVNTGTFNPWTPAPASGQPLVVAAAGDGASGESNSTNATNLIAGWNPDMVLYLGDVYEKGSPTEFRNWYGDATTYYGRFRSKTNPVVGNHEYEGNVAPGYFDYWDNIQHYYSYNTGGWHFIALDSTSQYGQTAAGSAQYQWLVNDLATNSQPCTLAYFHHPVYSVGPNGDTNRMNAIWSLLSTYSVDLVLNGHDHDYQRWLPLDGSGTPSPNGITQFVVGTGGHGVQGFVRTDSRLAIGVDTSPAGIGALKLQLSPGIATYQFVSATNGTLDSGSVSCSPSGSDTSSPTAPTNLVATPFGSNRIDLSWSAATDDSGVIGYDISRGGSFLASVSGATLTFSDTTAAASTTYTYTVKARDLAGNTSLASASASATTGSGTGSALFVDGFESGSLTGWTNTAMVVQGQEVYAGSWAARATTTSAASWAWHSLSSTQTNLYYRIRFKIVSQGANNMYLLKFRTSTGTSIGGLYLGDGGNTLNYRNDAGAVSVRSPRTAAAGVWHELQVHLVINGTSGQIETWLDGSNVPELSKVDNFGTTPVGRIQIADNSGTRAFDLVIDDVVVDTQFISSAPAPDTSPPTPPGNLTATPVSPTRINLAWTSAVDDVGVTAYDLFRDGEPLDSVIGSSTSYDDTHVDPGTSYVYTVKARDLAGNTSAASNSASATTPATVPDAPTGLAATGGNAQVGLSWSAPLANGGSPITSYRISRSTSPGTETFLVSTPTNATTYTDSTAVNGTTYYYVVAAVNAVGFGASSGEASATPAAAPTVPDAPTGLAATRGNGQLGLSWSAPLANGGSTITGYRVYRATTSGAETLLTTLGNVTSYTDLSLTNGTTYYYTVSAVNAIGEGAQSAETSGTPATVPDAPTGLAATGGNAQVGLSWSAPLANGGSPITSYRISRSTSPGTETFLVSTPTNATTYTDSTAVNGTTYYYGRGGRATRSASVPRRASRAPRLPTPPCPTRRPAWPPPAGNGQRRPVVERELANGGSTSPATGSTALPPAAQRRC